MRTAVLVGVVVAVTLASCSSYDPLTSDNSNLRTQIGEPIDEESAVKVTFLGNTTLVVQDAKTTLLVDGFLSRPGLLKTALFPVGPSAKIIMRELSAAGIHKVDGVLVGHAHHDHALDATAIADFFGAQAVGSASYAKLYNGSHVEGSKSELKEIPDTGGKVDFKDSAGNKTFTVHFLPSAHAAADSIPQWPIKGEIRETLKLPAYWTKLNVGAVFALRIEHAQGDIVVTTTAAAAKDVVLTGAKPVAVLFLAVGYLSKEDEFLRKLYLERTIVDTKPKLIVPTHWDDFTRKLSRGLKAPPLIFGNTEKAIGYVKQSRGAAKVRVLDHREFVLLKGGSVYIPDPVLSGKHTSHAAAPVRPQSLN